MYKNGFLKQKVIRSKGSPRHNQFTKERYPDCTEPKTGKRHKNGERSGLI
jgi:hypothetical protein